MAYSLHTTRIYKVEYGRNAINGSEQIDEFLRFIYRKRREAEPGSAWNDVHINEEETELDIPFSVLEELKDDEQWGSTAALILDNSDRDNAEAHLEIW